MKMNSSSEFKDTVTLTIEEIDKNIPFMTNIHFNEGPLGDILTLSLPSLLGAVSNYRTVSVLITLGLHIRLSGTVNYRVCNVNISFRLGHFND